MTTNNPPVPANEICPDHGPIGKHEQWGRYGCARCAAAADAYGERQLRAERRDQWLHESGLIGWQMRATFENYSATTAGQREAVEACRALVVRSDDRGPVPWLLGPPGTGKSHLGSAMVNHVIWERHLPAGIFSAREIVKMLRASWGKRNAEETEQDVIDNFAGMALLVIDEVGVGFGSESETVQLFDVIDLRYRLERPTALISNLTVKEIPSAIGERNADRLRQGARVVPMSWPTHREPSK